MFVVGTAGHVDHGKSTLVQALTGIDPDRLKAEKERGMTIDLGFAWLQLPSGNEVSIVDVPGHERFVNNMLAGVGGIDLALLVVAADEAVMPQTREHLAILDLLHVNRGVVAVTKRDLVDEDWLELVMADIEELIEGTALEGSPVVAVSAVTREGIDDLVSTIDSLLQQTEPKRDLGRPRLPIDRSFAMSGFGTVVTGTLVDGALDVGQEAELVLSGRKTRVRGLQAHRKRLDHAEPGPQGGSEPGRRAARRHYKGRGVDYARLALGRLWLSMYACECSTRLQGTSGTTCTSRFTPGAARSSAGSGSWEGDRIEPGSGHLGPDQARLTCGSGQRRLLRNQVQPDDTSAAAASSRLMRNATAAATRPPSSGCLSWRKVSDRDVLIATIASSEPAEFTSVVNRANLQPAAARTAAQGQWPGRGWLWWWAGRPPGPGVRMYTGTGWAAARARAREFPRRLSPAIPPKDRGAQGGAPEQNGNDPSDLQRYDATAQGRGSAGREGTLVRAADHQPGLTEEDQKITQAYIELLEASPYSPPSDSGIDAELLNLLADQGRVVKASGQRRVRRLRIQRNG